MRSSIAFVMLVGLAACDDVPTCGVTGVVDEAITIAGPGFEASFATLDACPCNDCPAEGEEPGVGITSITIAGEQVGAIGFFTLCIERPDRLNDAQQLGNDELGVPIHVNDLFGEAGGCTFRIDRAAPPRGTAKATGACDLGTHRDGFALELAAEAMIERTCDQAVDTIAVTINGRVAVEPPPD